MRAKVMKSSFFFFSQNIPESHKQNMVAGEEDYGSRYCRMPLEDEHNKKQSDGHFQQNSSMPGELDSVENNTLETALKFITRKMVK